MVEVSVGVIGGGIVVVGMTDSPLRDHHCGVFGLEVVSTYRYDAMSPWPTMSMPSYQLSSVHR